MNVVVVRPFYKLLNEFSIIDMVRSMGIFEDQTKLFSFLITSLTQNRRKVCESNKTVKTK